MAKKRGNSEGTVHNLPSGSWHAQVSLGGHRLSHTSITRQEAHAWLKKTTRHIDDGLTFANTKVTIADYLSGWLTIKKSALQHSTWVQYEQVIRSFINPGIGQIRLTNLRTEHVQELYASLLEQGVTIYAVRKSHTVLHSALQQAVKTGMINRNPASYADSPKIPSSEMAILDESQVSQLLVVATDHRWEALFHLTIVSGARQKELLGLKWIDLDWVKKTLKIERQLALPDGNGVRFSTTKTKYGQRTIVLGNKTIGVLRKHYERQQKDRIEAGEEWQENGLIFTTSVGTPIHPRNLLREYKQLLASAGLPDIRFHDLRHTSASLLLNNNIPPIVVSRRLGHSKPSVTLDVYGHLIPSMQSEAAELLDEVITPIPIEPRTFEKQLMDRD